MNHIPDVEDFAGSDIDPSFFILCFLWVDFIAPPSSDFIESLPIVPWLIESPLFFIESWLVLVGVAAVEAGVGEACEALCARAAPLTAMQPASIATISFVLRMGNLLGNGWRLGSVAMFGARHRLPVRPGLQSFADASPFRAGLVFAKQQIVGSRSAKN
jgi:hypothetical protein